MEHGTHGGVAFHRRNNEPKCDSCRNFKKEYSRANYLKNREVRLAYVKEYYRTHKEERNQKVAEWSKANRDKTREYNRRSYAKDPSKALRRVLKRKALKLKNGVEPYTLKEVLDWYGPMCYLCEEEIDLTLPRKIGVPGWGYGLHLDHVIPLSKGGKDCLENVAPTHALCNLIKRGN